MTIGDEFFPEGTVLSVNPYVLMTSKTLWGSDADQFKPERWLEPNAAALDKYFCPFGGGWASCPGQHLARVHISKTAVSSNYFGFFLWTHHLSLWPGGVGVDCVTGRIMGTELCKCDVLTKRLFTRLHLSGTLLFDR